MACARKDKACRGKVTTWSIWRAGEFQATSVTLCSHHGAPLTELEAAGQPEPLPARPRNDLKITKLKPIADTKHLKKTEKPPKA